ncbi:MAG: TetR/AcrR family transcriptional regulator [Myxococcota bacterium]
MSESLYSEGQSRRPGRPRKDDEQVADVRDRLLKAATELAVEQGFERCGLREIAARAEVSSGMISYYFKDRQGLYGAMVQRAFDGIAERISGIASASSGDGAEAGSERGGDRLDELVRIQVEALSADPWLPQLLLRELLANPDPKVREDVGEKVSQGPIQLMVAWLKAEQERGVLRSDFDPELMAMTVSSLSVFPFLMHSLIGDQVGASGRESFAETLIAHNQKLLAGGLRASAKEDEV